jgi:hypothetical protein
MLQDCDSSFVGVEGIHQGGEKRTMPGWSLGLLGTREDLLVLRGLVRIADSLGGVLHMSRNSDSTVVSLCISLGASRSREICARLTETDALVELYECHVPCFLALVGLLRHRMSWVPHLAIEYQMGESFVDGLEEELLAQSELAVLG